LVAERFRGRRKARFATAGIGLGRAALGAAVLVRPTALPVLLGVEETSATRLDWAVRMLGARDAALGLGAAWAVLTGGPVRPWLVAQAVGDGTDAVVFALGARSQRLPPVRAAALAMLAASAVLGGLALLPDADRPSTA
jgi:hypothetical protein